MAMTDKTLTLRVPMTLASPLDQMFPRLTPEQIARGDQVWVERNIAIAQCLHITLIAVDAGNHRPWSGNRRDAAVPQSQ